eukprot:574368-Hanusia_phi.AAC.1
MVGFDLLLGLASCYYSLTHARELLESTASISQWQSDVIVQGIRWLMGVPAGLKLNDNLGEREGREEEGRKRRMREERDVGG